MRTARLFPLAAMACLCALAVQTPGLACPQIENDQAGTATDARDQAWMPDAAHRRSGIAFLDRQIDRVSNQAMLDGLQQRRDDLVRTMPDNEPRRFALDFLDRQIAALRSELGE
jgi:hypothetical protein